MNEERNTRSMWIWIAVFVIVGLLSLFWFSSVASSEESFTGLYEDLDSKKTSVTSLMGVTAGAATAISLLPGDAGTPIADQMANLSGYFLVILTAIFIEKWMLTITGWLAFKILIPVGCGLLIASLLLSNDKLRQFGAKLILFAIVIFLIVPASIGLTSKIDKSSRESIKMTIEETEKETKKIKDAAGNDKDKNAIEKIIGTVKGGVSAKINEFEGLLKQISEHIAALIVTSCVVPIGVILFFFWVIKAITGIDINLPMPKGAGLLGRLRR